MHWPNTIPRFRPLASSVARISSGDLTSTKSPGCKCRASVGVRVWRPTKTTPMENRCRNFRQDALIISQIISQADRFPTRTSPMHFLNRPLVDSELVAATSWLDWQKYAGSPFVLLVLIRESKAASASAAPALLGSVSATGRTQAVFQKSEHERPQPSCAEPSHRSSSRKTTSLFLNSRM